MLRDSVLKHCEERKSPDRPFGFLDLYETYPDFQIDVEAEKQRLLKFQRILFQHPFYWYSCPPLLKHYFDEVLELGFAYGPGGQALKGKHWQQIITTGGSAEVYSHEGSNCYTMDEFLRPYEQTARLCGMRYHSPLILHAARRLTEEARRKAIDSYKKLVDSHLEGEIV